jgi:hypothetical protein
VPDRRLQGMWTELKRAIRVRWPEVTAADIASLGDERDALMRVLKSRSTKSYAQIDREIADFEAHDLRVGYARRLSPGIGTG